MYSKSKEDKYVSQISDKAFKQLAINNVKKSIKDYMIYFITLSFGVALLYSFNSIDNILSKFMGNGLLDAYIYMSKGILAVFSIVICLIFGFLITYSNNFLMKKRKREFGIYATLGMDKRDINKLMFKETVIIGFFALCFGLIFGIFASQGLSIIAFKMTNLDSTMFKFSISMSAIIKTVLLFGFVLFLVNKFNKRNINNHRLIDLINLNRKNENFNANKGIKNTFILSIIIILGSYILIKSLREPNIIKISIFIILISIGTYLFFISISDFVLNQIKKRKKLYYNNLTMFVTSQISSRIKSMSLCITIICLVLFSALIVIPFGMSFADYFKDGVERLTPFHATIVRHNDIEYEVDDSESTYYSEGLYSSNKEFLNKPYKSLKNELMETNFPYSNLVSDSTEVRVYTLQDVTVSKIVNNVSNKNDYCLSILTIDDYNNIRKQQGLDSISIGSDEFLANINGFTNQEVLEKLLKNIGNITLNVNNHLLNLSKIDSDIYYHNSVVDPNHITVVVPHEVVDNLYPIMTYLNINYIQLNNQYDNAFYDAIYDFNYDNNYDLMFESKLVIDGEKISLNLVFSFIAIYLGIILIISSGAILALEHISELTVNKKRFKILKKLGVNEKDMRKALFVQVLILFMAPLILASVHTIFISGVLHSIILELSSTGLFKNILISSIIVITIYSLYLFASYYESLRSIEQE